MNSGGALYRTHASYQCHTTKWNTAEVDGCVTLSTELTNPLLHWKRWKATKPTMIIAVITIIMLVSDPDLLPVGTRPWVNRRDTTAAPS